VPEILEVESYRRLADRVVGSVVARGWSDAYSAKKLTSPTAWARAVKGLTLSATSRRGKLLLLETNGVRLGIRFGMTGVLLIDDEAGIDGLFYGPHLYKAEWVRGGLEFDDGRKLILHDPRRLGRFEIDPDLSELGPDALTLTRKQFDQMVAIKRGEGPPIKARLLDQSVVAGVGNLLGDEILYRAGIDPRTPTGRLSSEQKSRLYRAFCPKDGAAMLSATIGGRTTYWCSKHQY
jgi:formamidopyrimidine-DNA glycosylase